MFKWILRIHFSEVQNPLNSTPTIQKYCHQNDQHLYPTHHWFASGFFVHSQAPAPSMCLIGWHGRSFEQPNLSLSLRSLIPLLRNMVPCFGKPALSHGQLYKSFLYKHILSNPFYFSPLCYSDSNSVPTNLSVFPLLHSISLFCNKAYDKFRGLVGKSGEPGYYQRLHLR